MNIKITLSDDHIKLIPFLFIQKEGDKVVLISKDQLFSLGSHLLEDMAFILGLIDKAIPSSIDDENGRAFPKEITDYMLELYEYFSVNLYYIESLVHYYVIKGGLSSGTYICKENEMLWHKEGED